MFLFFKLAGISCQALWNFLIDSSNVIDTLGDSESDLLAGLLAEYLGEVLLKIKLDVFKIKTVTTIFFPNSNWTSTILDDEKIFQGKTPDPMWEQFAQVATDLLESLQSCMSMGSSPIASFDYDDDDANSLSMNGRES